MRRITLTLIFLVCLAFLPVTQVTAALFGDDTLVSIDGENYSIEDFKHWWKYWNDNDSPLPETPDPYVDWLLLSREAERMDLDKTPEFKRQTRIFLQSRTLLMLKYDAVDSKITVTEADIKTRYTEQYQPLWNVQRLEFKDEKTAIAAWQDLAAGTLLIDDLRTRAAEQGGPVSTVQNWLRPNGTDPDWVTILQKLKVGEAVNPNDYGKGPFLYFLNDKKENDEEDFAKVRADIRRELWKEQENKLTRQLITELREKYKVEVDEERIAALDLNAADDTFTDTAVITTSKQNITEKEFMNVIRKLMISRPAAAHAASDEEVAVTLKNETVYNIIAQSVTNWESLDRHYEEKEPFKWEYEFNFRHRLKLALEQRVFAPEATVSEEEIKQHYEENIALYTQPTLVQLYIIDETQGPIDQIWADIAVGKNFQDVLKEQFGQPIKPQNVPANHLDPEVKEVVDILVDGETSQIFMAQGIRVMVHLVERTPEAPLPLERVKRSISSSLWREKLNQMRSNYLETVKSGSAIDVRQRNWKKIQKELGGAS